MQLSFPFAREEQAPEPSVWVVACLDKPTDWFAKSLERFRHFFVNADDGASTIGKNDTLIVRDRSSGLCQAYTAEVTTSSSEVSPPFRMPLAASRDASVQRLVAIFLGYEGGGTAVPDRHATRLERLLATLRHPMFEETPLTRLSRSTEARTALADVGDGTLLAVLDREGADAARSLYDARYALQSDIDVTQALHCRAAKQFRAAGMPDNASRAERAFQYWMARSEPTLPLPEFDRPVQKRRIGYRCVSLLARRIDVQAHAVKPAEGTVPTKRKIDSSLHVDTDALCAWLGEADAGKVAAWYEWEVGDGDTATLKLGVDDRLSVELGLAGRTGLKESIYNVRLWGEGCEISRATATLMQGDALTISVKTYLGCEGALEIRFVDASGRQLGLKLKAPTWSGTVRSKKSLNSAMALQ